MVNIPPINMVMKWGMVYGIAIPTLLCIGYVQLWIGGRQQNLCRTTRVYDGSAHHIVLCQDQYADGPVRVLACLLCVGLGTQTSFDSCSLISAQLYGLSK